MLNGTFPEMFTSMLMQQPKHKRVFLLMTLRTTVAAAAAVVRYSQAPARNPTKQ